jgi:hypothetical protein
MRDAHAQPDFGAGGDAAREAEVLSEAVAKLGEWSSRLPADSPWREAFDGIASVAAQSVGLHERLHRRHAA